MKKILMAILIIVGVLSCVTDNSIQVTYIDQSILSNAIHCKEELLDVNDSIFVGSSDFFVYKDSILIISKNNPKDGCFLEIRRLEDKKLIAKYFRKGNGKEELLSANVDINGNLLFVNDYVKSQFSIMDIDSIIENKDYKCILHKNSMTSSPTVVPYKGTFLVENPYCYNDSDMSILQGVEQGNPRFLKLNELQDDFESDKFVYDTRNVAVDGRIICNLKNNNIVYAHFGKSILEFYDDSLLLKKMVKGPLKMDIEYSVYAIPGITQKQVAYKNRIPYSYLGFCCDMNYVYLLYIGDYLKKETDIYNMSSYILKFDWNGNFEKSYYIGSYLSSISKGNTQDCFYATTIANNGQRNLIRIIP